MPITDPVGKARLLYDARRDRVAHFELDAGEPPGDRRRHDVAVVRPRLALLVDRDAHRAARDVDRVGLDRPGDEERHEERHDGDGRHDGEGAFERLFHDGHSRVLSTATMSRCRRRRRTSSPETSAAPMTTSAATA